MSDPVSRRSFLINSHVQMKLPCSPSHLHKGQPELRGNIRRGKPTRVPLMQSIFPGWQVGNLTISIYRTVRSPEEIRSGLNLTIGSRVVPLWLDRRNRTFKVCGSGGACCLFLCLTHVDSCKLLYTPEWATDDQALGERVSVFFLSRSERAAAPRVIDIHGYNGRRNTKHPA